MFLNNGMSLNFETMHYNNKGPMLPSYYTGQPNKLA